jgi:uncharacterized protein
MSTALFEASHPVFLRYLSRLDHLVATAQAHPQAAALLTARLAPDMLPFEMQVAIASGFTLRACFPLAGKAIPPETAFPSTFAGLHARIAHAAGLLGSLQRSQFEGAERRIIESRAGEALVSLRGPEFLYQYALPNFFFHLTAAYAILRHQGIALGKEDFDGWHAY